MAEKRQIGFITAVISILAVLGLLGWFLTAIFEWEKPQVEITPLPDFLTGKQEVVLTVCDRKSGIRRVEVWVREPGRVIPVFDKEFPFEGLLNQGGTHWFETPLSIDPIELNLSQGQADLRISVWDHSRKNGGEGNLSTVDRRITVDTIPPTIRSLSVQNYINLGGAGFTVYETSPDAVRSGVFVGDIFFPGFPAEKAAGNHVYVSYFCIPLGLDKKPEIFLWAEDEGGNRSRAAFHCHVRQKRFRADKMNLTDPFLEKVLPYFDTYLKDTTGRPIDKYLKINRELRQENARTFEALGKETVPERLWEGDWLRLKNAASMAQFGDRRSYYYEGKKVDEQTHMGVDLASLANAEVPAANNGRVIFAGDLGIYGRTVVLDHGQGLASIYSHLSGIKVEKGQLVQKGDVIGTTGQTGLAGGDHLHFGMMIKGIFINPIEWWDSHWIADNITSKLSLKR